MQPLFLELDRVLRTHRSLIEHYGGAEGLTGELGVHARQPWEKQLYQRLFGKHLFGDEQLFSGMSKYTLDPLQIDGEAALRCEDVPGIEWVRLGELRIFQPARVPRSECFNPHRHTS
jgi:hypothetical protein